MARLELKYPSLLIQTVRLFAIFGRPLAANANFEDLKLLHRGMDGYFEASDSKELDQQMDGHPRLALGFLWQELDFEVPQGPSLLWPGGKGTSGFTRRSGKASKQQLMKLSRMLDIMLYLGKELKDQRIIESCLSLGCL